MHGGRILFFTNRKKQLITKLKYISFTPRGTLMILHQNIFFKMIENKKRTLNCNVTVFYTHHSSVEPDELTNLKLLRKATKVIVCSLEIKKFLIRFVGLDFENKIHVVLGGADISRFKSINVNRNPSNVLFVSNLTGRKRPDLIVRTVKENSDFFFTLHGKNWLGSIFLDQLNSLPNFRYIDFDFQKANEIYNQSSIFMSLSDLEGAPMPALESLAAGCKVVLTNTGFAQELSDISKSVVVIPINPSSIDVKNSLRIIQYSPYPHANIRESFDYLKFLKEFIPK
jgi:glycosyltransferase involved in cell wall biosynthesis